MKHLLLALTLAASVTFADEPPSYPVDVEDGGPAVQGTITTSRDGIAASELPQAITPQNVVLLVTRHIQYPDNTFDYYFNDAATSYDPVVSNRTGHRTIGLSLFVYCNGAPCAIPYVYCPEHGLYEFTSIVHGATITNDAAVAAQLTSNVRARTHAGTPDISFNMNPLPPQAAPGVVQTIPAVYQIPPARAIVSQPSNLPSAPEETKAERSFPWTALWWCGGLLGFVILWMIASYVTEEMFDHRRPIRIEASEHNREVDAFQGRLTRDANHLHRLNAAVDEEERRFIDRITRIQKGA